MITMHPGRFISEEFFGTVEDYVKGTGLGKEIVEKLLSEEIDVNEEIAQALSQYTGNSPEFWLRMQRHHNEKINKT